MSANDASRASALRKVQACLRLAGSNNATEAATALRQARALMRKYGLTDADAAAADVGTAEAPTGFRGGMIPQSLVALATLVAEGYRCAVVIQQRRRQVIGNGGAKTLGETVVHFYGVGADPQVAAYAFVVLRRQLQRGKAAHIRRVRKQANKERRGEMFALGFVTALRLLFPREELTQNRQGALDAAVAQRHGELGTTTGKAITRGRGSDNDRWAGFEAGERARLNKGMSVGARQLEVFP